MVRDSEIDTVAGAVGFLMKTTEILAQGIVGLKERVATLEARIKELDKSPR